MKKEDINVIIKNDEPTLVVLKENKKELVQIFWVLPSCFNKIQENRNLNVFLNGDVKEVNSALLLLFTLTLTRRIKINFYTLNPSWYWVKGTQYLKKGNRTFFNFLYYKGCE